jgi:hypothetical protein
MEADTDQSKESRERQQDHRISVMRNDGREAIFRPAREVDETETESECCRRTIPGSVHYGASLRQGLSLSAGTSYRSTHTPCTYQQLDVVLKFAHEEGQFGSVRTRCEHAPLRENKQSEH